LLAHGKMGDEGDQRWLGVINNNIRRIQKDLSQPFKAIMSMTLREDWPDKRQQALVQIREETER